MEKNEDVKFQETVRRVITILLLLLLIISIVGLYISANTLIDVWAGYKYAPIYKVLMNAALLIIAAHFLMKSKG
ncbi:MULTISPECIES: hypothetical protein [unclassified Archaeoglobus]|jgi:hypothetical protein|uniref:hypothetical protein n=1 Tax=unclassified Archaeoglobus TaxID=2643606 RepID=UPI0025BC694E|nr:MULTISPECIES: hypothetical protein [unclassified Archaeoglobus]